jgi:hypothetical protein
MPTLGLGLGLSRGGLLNTGGGGGVAPSNSVAPAISGVQIVGQTLNTTNGTWTGDPTITFTYQWQRSADGGVNWTNIIGATSNTHVIQAAGAGNLTRCQVTASNAFGDSTPAFSNAISVRATIADIYSANIESIFYLSLHRGAYYGSPCIRVRRSSDNTEQNIGFTTSGSLDTTALLAFCGAGNGFIVTIFDQSLNARNVTQTNVSLQFQIVSSGALITQSGLTVFRANGSLSQGSYTKTASSLNGYTLFHYSNISGTGGRRILGNGLPDPAYSGNVPFTGFRDSGNISILGSVNTSFIKKQWLRNGANGQLFYGGVSQGTTSALRTTEMNYIFYMLDFFGTNTTEDIRGSIVYNTNLSSADILAINNLLD